MDIELAEEYSQDHMYLALQLRIAASEISSKYGPAP
jgi:hypothetical protein